MQDKPLDYLILAGGTGGHIFPALALAQALTAQGHSLAWLGSQQSMEARRVPEAGISFYSLSVSGLRGKGRLALVKAPWRLLRATWQALRLLQVLRPRKVVGFGGFASGPGGLAARLLGIPLFIHEQNACPGMTNRCLAPLSCKVFTAFPSAFSNNSKLLARNRVLCIGNPVRQGLLDLPPVQTRYSARQGPLRVLVVGGSLGAQVFNEVLPEALSLLPEDQWPLVQHQAGAGKEEQARQNYVQHLGELPAAVTLSAFIEDMTQAYAWADLVICRAGALTVSELAAVGVASLLVPFPFAVDDHQTHNARFLADAKAAQLLPQKHFNAKALAGHLADRSGYRQDLAEVAQRARKLARPEATQHLLEQLL